MKKHIQTAFIMAVSVIAVLSAGCQEEELASEKKSRLIAAENIRLQKEIDLRDTEIERLKQLHLEELEKQQEQLAQCQKQTQTWREKAQANIKEQVDSVLTTVMNENAKLREEVDNLIAQIKKLKEKTKIEEKPLETEVP